MYRFSIPAFLLTLACGFLTGSAVTAWATRTPPTLELIEDKDADVPVVSITGIRDGALVGSVTGPVRLSAGGEPVRVGSGGAFAVSDRSLLTNVITVSVPEGMKFVASRRGKKYYSVDSSDAQRIVPENRVYFKDEESAKRAGYVR